MCGLKLTKYIFLLAVLSLLSFDCALAAEGTKVFKDRYVVTRVPQIGMNTRSALKYGGLAKERKGGGFIGFTEVKAVEISVQSSFRSNAKNQLVDLDKADASFWCENIKKYDSSVIDCEPDYYFKINTVDALLTPTDTYYSAIQANMNSIQAPESWDITQGAGVVVAVIDTGVLHTHPDLVGNILINAGEIADDGIDNDNNGYIDDVVGYDVFNGDNDPTDDHAHGTHVAGTIGASVNNAAGVVGVAPGVSLLPVKVLGADGSGSYSNIVAGVNYATSRGAHIMNMSVGGSSANSILSSAIDAARQAGILVVAAAGNDYQNVDTNEAYKTYPAAYAHDNIISVAAYDASNGEVANFSNTGAVSVDIGAPGFSIASTVLADGYGYMSGTSMATPHVAGAAALIKAAYPTATYTAIRSALLNNSTLNSNFSGEDAIATGGQINILAALQNYDPNGGSYTPTPGSPGSPGDSAATILKFGRYKAKTGKVKNRKLNKKKDFVVQHVGSAALTFQLKRGSKVRQTCSFSGTYSSGSVFGKLPGIKGVNKVVAVMDVSQATARITKSKRRKSKRTVRKRSLLDACSVIEAGLSQ